MRSWKRVASLSALILLCALGGVARAAPGAIDPSFGNGGELRMLPSHEDIAIRAVAAQPDSRIVLAGADQTVGQTIVLRLLPNGERDPSFGNGGLVSLQVGSEASEARALALQPDGKIVVGGTAKGATKYGFSVLRLNPDGSLDTGFGAGNGVQVVSVGPEEDSGEALALGPDGRIVVTGEARLPGDSAAGLAVLGPDGSPDAGYFGGDGVTTFTTSQGFDDGVAVAMLADGRVLLADSNGAGGGHGFTLAQLLQSGLPDPGFGGGDGLVEVSPPSQGEAAGLGGRITDFELLADGRIVATGYGYDQVGNPPQDDLKAAVARFLADGQLDASFGSGGFSTHQFGPFDEQPGWIGVTPSGRPLIAATNFVQVTPSSIESPALARLDPDGGLDPTFGVGGQVLNGATAPFGEPMEAAALDPEERTIVVGRAYIGGGDTEVVLRRYLGDKVPLGPRGPNLAPHARLKKLAKKLKRGKPRSFAGTASDADGSVAKVQIAVARLVRGGARVAAKRRAPRCLVMKNARAKFKAVKPVGPKGRRACPQRWLTAKGTAKWKYKLKKALPPGRYVVYARAVDGEGLAETAFTRKAGNRYAFRVLARRAR